MMADRKSLKKLRKHHRASSRRLVQYKQGNELVLSVYRNAKWATITLAAALFLAPFAGGYISAAAALWTSLIMAAVIGGLGYRMRNKWATLAGAVAMIAPWALAFSGLTAARCQTTGGHRTAQAACSRDWTKRAGQ